MQKYRFLLENMAVVSIVEHDNSITASALDVIVCTIPDAKSMMPLIGLNIDKVLEFEASLNG